VRTTRFCNNQVHSQKIGKSNNIQGNINIEVRYEPRNQVTRPLEHQAHQRYLETLILRCVTSLETKSLGHSNTRPIKGIWKHFNIEVRYEPRNQVTQPLEHQAHQRYLETLILRCVTSLETKSFGHSNTRPIISN
jgi:hypothetical protein